MLVSVSDGKTTRSSENATTLASVSYDKMIRKSENALGGMTDYPNFAPSPHARRPRRWARAHALDAPTSRSYVPGSSSSFDITFRWAGGGSKPAGSERY
jgi:hypothetical protein